MLSRLRRPGWIRPSAAGSVASVPGFHGSWVAMCGCRVGGTTACAGVKQEWGLSSAAVTSSLLADCFSLLSVSSPFGRTLFWSWAMLGGGWRLRLAVGVLRWIDSVSRVAKGPSLLLVTVEVLMLVRRHGLFSGHQCGGACVGDVKMLAKALPCLWLVRRRRCSWAPFPFLEAMSWRSFISPTNLQVKILFRLSNEQRRHYASCPPWGRRFGEVPMHQRLLMVFFTSKLSYLVFGEAFAFLGSLRFLWWASRSSVVSVDEVGATR
uniref:Uncharacterized protein n=1 Tax=Oryza barthii TaxID=65489 RepID=A0A0D3GMY6_9ORYZ